MKILKIINVKIKISRNLKKKKKINLYQNLIKLFGLTCDNIRPNQIPKQKSNTQKI